MKLADWLEQQSLSASEFAREINDSPTNVWRYANGKRIPNKTTMAKIVARTKGAVTANDFYDTEAAPPVRGGRRRAAAAGAR